AAHKHSDVPTLAANGQHFRGYLSQPLDSARPAKTPATNCWQRGDIGEPGSSIQGGRAATIGLLRATQEKIKTSPSLGMDWANDELPSDHRRRRHRRAGNSPYAPPDWGPRDGLLSGSRHAPARRRHQSATECRARNVRPWPNTQGS